VADIERPSVKRQIKDLEQSIVHYGDTTLLMAAQLREHGPTYASAVAMEETTMVDFNRDRRGQPRLVAIYPDEGTFVSDSPYLVLKAPWVTKAQQDGAQAFQRFIASHVTPQLAARYGFRPPDPAQAPVAPVDAANGLDPKQPSRVLGMPEPSVVARIQKAWLENRKAANIELVVDTSTSMNDQAKIVHARDGLKEFLGQLSPRDRVGMIAFSTDVNQVTPLEPFSHGEAGLRAAVNGLLPNGETSLYDAVDAGVAAVARLHDSKHINAVVVLTDGMNTTGQQTLDGLLPHLAAHAGAEAVPIRVFTIAYGNDASVQILAKIAKTAGGESYTGTTGNIGQVYTHISSFF
jgi:Ca-activated chloride channel family protein